MVSNSIQFEAYIPINVQKGGYLFKKRSEVKRQVNASILPHITLPGQAHQYVSSIVSRQIIVNHIPTNTDPYHQQQAVSFLEAFPKLSPNAPNRLELNNRVSPETKNKCCYMSSLYMTNMNIQKASGVS